MKPGYKNKGMTLDERMKSYEKTTDFLLTPNIPVYVRIDQRAGHTFTHGLNKPFDKDYMYAISETTKYLVAQTNATIGYCQSDEISLVYKSPEKMPFENRIFKIQSVFASMATSAFIKACLETNLKDRVMKMLPSFDCRVCQMPDYEITNMILWREKDCRKNAITLAALDMFSTKQIDKKNSDDKILMMKEKGFDFESLPENIRYGSYFRRVLYKKYLQDNTICKEFFTDDGGNYVLRSKIDNVYLGAPLTQIENRIGVILNGEDPILKND